MKRVFPRGRLKLLCQCCAEKGKGTPAGVQGGTLALCWDCFNRQEKEKKERKEALGRQFNAAMLGVDITDDRASPIEEDDNAAID